MISYACGFTNVQSSLYSALFSCGLTRTSVYFSYEGRTESVAVSDQRVQLTTTLAVATDVHSKTGTKRLVNTKVTSLIGLAMVGVLQNYLTRMLASKVPIERSMSSNEAYIRGGTRSHRKLYEDVLRRVRPLNFERLVDCLIPQLSPILPNV